jgi:hypothetical protein
VATLTEQVIWTLETEPQLFELTMAEVAAHLQREQALADRLDAALREVQQPEQSGWIDWSEVIEHFRQRVSAGYVRDELRRNQRVTLSAEDVAQAVDEDAVADDLTPP